MVREVQLLHSTTVRQRNFLYHRVMARVGAPSAETVRRGKGPGRKPTVKMESNLVVEPGPTATRCDRKVEVRLLCSPQVLLAGRLIARTPGDKPGNVGATPTPPTNADVAQLGEHSFRKREVDGFDSLRRLKLVLTKIVIPGKDKRIKGGCHESRR